MIAAGFDSVPTAADPNLSRVEDMSTKMAPSSLADLGAQPAHLAARLAQARTGERDDEAIAFIVDRSRVAGNAAFRAGRFRGASRGARGGGGPGGERRGGTAAKRAAKREPKKREQSAG